MDIYHKLKQFKSLNYYDCVLDIEHCQKLGLNISNVIKKYKKYNLSLKKIKVIQRWKIFFPKKWNFFEDQVKLLKYKIEHWNKLSIQDKNDLTEYKDFFVYRYRGLVFRWDGNSGFLDSRNRHLIKTLSGTNKMVNKIMYATRPLQGFHYSYKKMKGLKIVERDPDNKNVFNISVKKISKK